MAPIRPRHDETYRKHLMADSWMDREPDFFALRSEVARLWRRAQHRRKWVLLGAAATALLAALFTWRMPHKVQAMVSIRVTEVVDFRLPRSSWTDRELRSYVTDVAFTNQVLRGIYDRYLREQDSKKDPGRAVELLREQLDVQVVRNRIVMQMEGKTGPRSAHVVLRFAAPTTQKAMGVLQALVEPIIRTSAQRRRGEAVQEIRRATLSLEEGQKLLADLNQQAFTNAGSPVRGARVSPVRLTALNEAIAEAQRRVERFTADKDAAERRERSEKARPGINFYIAEQSVRVPLRKEVVAGGVALLVFLLSLPLAALVVGAFDPFIGSVEDIRRLGIPTLGRLRHVRLRSTEAR
jgi:hypothetical protein